MFFGQKRYVAASLAAGTAWASCRAEMAIGGTWCVYARPSFMAIGVTWGVYAGAALKATTSYT
ncbi:hypothetical protein EHV15_31025 [Paenibacillus oralis]|uniref:Uncharacterized protein n=1 Tax=Paenibacillus oralis TaxID=2490856 RepID=A0A3P3U939_9BACL|nr:hypothetical protein [Paenibacillus oralis]RRJ66872.1 hypothetical protein EHV15_31025 [Paenibacillus oralis]